MLELKNAAATSSGTGDGGRREEGGGRGGAKARARIKTPKSGEVCAQPTAGRGKAPGR